MQIARIKGAGQFDLQIGMGRIPVRSPLLCSGKIFSGVAVLPSPLGLAQETKEEGDQESNFPESLVSFGTQKQRFASLIRQGLFLQFFHHLIQSVSHQESDENNNKPVDDSHNTSPA
nr:hypothetical protein [uncultured Cohaesibacter sp.]